MTKTSLPKLWPLLGVCTALTTMNVAAQNLASPPMATDKLVIVEGAKALTGIVTNNVVAIENGKGLGLKPEALTGTVQNAIKADFEFNEMVPSWNVVCTTGTGMRLWMSTAAQPGDSDWFVAAQWGTPQPAEVAPRVQKLKGGDYVTDTLLLKKPTKNLHYRAEFFRDSAVTPTPKLYMVSAVYSNTLGNKAIYEAFGDKRPVKLSPSGKKLELKMDFMPQLVNNPAWIGQICSPNSVAMALGKFGLPCTVDQASTWAYDPTDKIFGNWVRAVSTGSQFGARGYITRFRNFSQVRDALKKGYVICPSIKFAYGACKLDEVPVMYAKRGTDGHLIVLTGIDKDAKIITHDNSSKVNGASCRWSQDALITAWFNTKGGVAYVFTGKR